jgi:hypothetical protein
MIPTFVPKRAALMAPRLFAITALLLVAATPALGATSAQQVYEAPETVVTPSPLPNLSVPPAGEVQLPGPFTPRAIQGLDPTPPGPLVAGSGEPAPTSSPCIPAAGATPGTGSGSGVASPAGSEECAPAPGDGTAVAGPRSPAPGGSTPVGEVASEPGSAPTAGGSGTLPVTGLDLIIILAAAVTAAGVGISLRKAAR